MPEFMRFTRERASDIARLVRQGVISREEYMDIKARSDEGDTTITEDKKADTYDEIMRDIDEINMYTRLVLDFLKRKD